MAQLTNRELTMARASLKSSLDYISALGFAVRIGVGATTRRVTFEEVVFTKVVDGNASAERLDRMTNPT